MSRQICHVDPCEPTPDVVESTLGEVVRANLNGRLYLHPRETFKRKALRMLRAAGLAERVVPSPTNGGGWFARLRDSTTLRA